MTETTPRCTQQRRRSASRWVASLALVATISASRAAAADTEAQIDPRFWDPSWRKVGLPEYAITGVASTALVLHQIFLQPEPVPSRWTDSMLFDDRVRDALVVTNPNTVETLDTVSSVLFITVTAYPAAVDVPVAWARGGSRLAWQLAWQDTTVLATAAAIDLYLRDTVARARPRTVTCFRNGGNEECEGSQAARSFPAGHFAMTSAASALLCTQHLHTKLYGGAGDAIACGTSIAASLTVGALRIVTDDHWATDTIVGGTLGSLIGWGLPTLLNYGGLWSRGSGEAGPPRVVVTPVPLVTRDVTGLSLTGAF